MQMITGAILIVASSILFMTAEFRNHDVFGVCGAVVGLFGLVLLLTGLVKDKTKVNNP